MKFDNHANLFLLFITVFGCSNADLDHKEIEKIIERTRPGYEYWLKDIGSKLVIDTAQLRFWLSEFKDPFANIVMQSQFENVNDLDQAIKLVISHAQKSQSPVCWPVTVALRPRQTAATLKKNGFEKVLTYEMVELNIKDAHFMDIKNADIEIKKLDFNSIQEWLNIVGNAFEYNPLLAKACLKYLEADIKNNSKTQEHFAGYYKGKLVSTGTLLIEYYGGGHVYDIATLPEVQRNGMATAMMQFIIKRAQDLGVKTINLLATDQGKSIYQKFGFKKLYDIDMYVYNPY